jgi:hypothetical protein
MKKIIKLTDSDLSKIIHRVLIEQSNMTSTAGLSIGAKEDVNPKRLKLGDGGKRSPNKSEDVKKLQKRLMDLGFLKTKSMIPTGYFGPLTQSALDNYESSGSVKKGQETKKQVQQKKGVVQNQGYKLTPRIDQELDFIKARGLDNKPFFIYDPLQNLIYLFNTGGSYVASSSVVDGKDKQKEGKPFNHQDWCKLSGLESSPHLCTDPKSKQKKDPYYSVLSNLAVKFVPKGIYSIGNLLRHEGYQGAGKNLFQMKDENGKLISAAIHGIPNLPDRLKASNDLEALLKSQLSDGRVPQKYLDSVKTIANANMSFGCVGVPAKFIENPKVQSLAKGARVFVMGESGKGFLVQNADEYFNKLSGDGENCVNPMSLASKMSNMA